MYTIILKTRELIEKLTMEEGFDHPNILDIETTLNDIFCHTFILLVGIYFITYTSRKVNE